MQWQMECHLRLWPSHARWDASWAGSFDGPDMPDFDAIGQEAFNDALDGGATAACRSSSS